MHDEISNQSIGKRVAQLRKKQNLTQAQLADLINSTPKHISEIERGVTGISIDMQVQLCKKLRCSLDYLIMGKDYETVEVYLPLSIINILHSNDEPEKNLLLEYMKLYERIRN